MHPPGTAGFDSPATPPFQPVVEVNGTPARGGGGRRPSDGGVSVAGLVGGAALVASLFVRWNRVGPGARLRGDQLAALLLHGPVLFSRQRLAGALLYGVAFVGVIVIASSISRSRPAAAARVVASLPIAIAFVGFVFSRWSGLGSMGPYVAGGGAIVTVTGSAIELLRTRANRSPG